MSNFIFYTTLIFFVIQSGKATLAAKHDDTGECKTTGSADSLFSVVDTHKPYVFMSFEQYVPNFVVARVFLQGQSGTFVKLEIKEILGLAAIVKDKAYFFNIVGCPTVVYVPNNNSTVYGYANLYGSQIYQAFRAITSKCDFQCNSCSTSPVNADKNIVSYTAGKYSVTFRNIQSYSIVPVDGIPPASLFEKINSVLKQNPVQNYSLQSFEQCVNINNKYPFLLPCPVVNKSFQSLPLTNSIHNPVYQQKDQFCSYIIGQSQVLSKTPQRIFTLYRFLIPSTVCNSFAVITCYSTNQLLEFIAQVVITSCG